MASDKLISARAITGAISASDALSGAHPACTHGLVGGEIVDRVSMILENQPLNPAHHHAALGEVAHGVGGPAAAFQLHHVGTGLHQGRGAANRLLARFLVAAKRKIADHPHAVRLPRATHCVW